ncbi:hypothetical protein KUW17_18690 [Leisingera aquaemixtae]|uniref:hypothetical protein n=1 Tax=Leisingera aquaemixtae TaxID=1396826 RepID=UPI001C970347|nr:hypothetical protein [Leisingera aquaemixtae]MBY6068777.1 hypothetical protein [Leisingera aquaemixtae]
MTQWHRYRTGLALAAALCFALLAGLHAARPVAADQGFAAFGYAASDICGFGEGGAETRSCPNCTLAAGAVLPQSKAPEPLCLFRRTAAAGRGGWIAAPGVVSTYQARAPPVFT